jgi:organic hydroperoxide reductase OsmC/OhrA
MPRTHSYEVSVEWTGNTGTGTSGYRDYERSHTVRAAGLPDIAGSADRVFRGAKDRWNPEQLLVVARSQCHLLSYLHVAADAGVVVTADEDDAIGTMAEDGRGGGSFSEVVLRPKVTVADPATAERARELHERAHELCFIAASVNFPVRHEPR